VAIAVGALAVLFGLLRDIKGIFTDEKGRALLAWVAILLAVGSVFYYLVEGWALIDAFYFSVVTLTTVGYGDFTPDTTAGKLFTVVYTLFGLSLIAVFAKSLAEVHVQRVSQKATARRQGRATHD
jgi:voltage-gated potassium channel Kch